jgi:hypothetical protein
MDKNTIVVVPVALPENIPAIAQVIFTLGDDGTWACNLSQESMHYLQSVLSGIVPVREYVNPWHGDVIDGV